MLLFSAFLCNEVPYLRLSLIVNREKENEGRNDCSHEKILSSYIGLHVAIHIVSFNREGRPVTVIDAEEAEWMCGQKFDLHVG